MNRALVAFFTVLSFIAQAGLANCQGLWNAYNEADVGVNYASAAGIELDVPSNDLRKHAFGVSAGMQTSIALSSLPQQDHKVRVGDLIKGRLITGYNTGSLWGGYRFDLGLTTLVALKRSRIGLNFTPLIFAHDGLAPNISGSSLGAFVQFAQILLEAGAEARNDRFAGFTRIAQAGFLPHWYTSKITLKGSGQLLYGFELFAFSDQRTSKALTSFRIFYGKTF